MKALKRLERKLNWFEKIRKKVVVTGLAAGLLVPSGIIGVPYLVQENNKWVKKRALQELVQDPVKDSFISGIKKESIDFFVKDMYDYKEQNGIWAYRDTGAYKELDDVIVRISERTDIPKYIFAALIDYCRQCGDNPRGYYSWSGRTPITPEEAGVKGLVLWQDPEQDLLSAAGKYNNIFREVQDEAVAVALMFTEKESVKKAKREASIAYARLREYDDWRSRRSAEDLEKYYALVKQRNAVPFNDWEKKGELEKQLKALFDDITTEKPSSSGDARGSFAVGNRSWHPDLFKVTLSPMHWKYKCWWVNNLSIGGAAVKIALRLKKDGYR